MKHCHVIKNVIELQMMNISSQTINKIIGLLKKMTILEYPIVDFS